MNVFIYSCMYVLYILQVRTDYVPKSGKKSRDLRMKKLAVDDTFIEAVKTPKQGRNRAKIIAQ